MVNIDLLNNHYEIKKRKKTLRLGYKNDIKNKPKISNLVESLQILVAVLVKEINNRDDILWYKFRFSYKKEDLTITKFGQEYVISKDKKKQEKELKFISESILKYSTAYKPKIPKDYIDLYAEPIAIKDIFGIEKNIEKVMGKLVGRLKKLTNSDWFKNRENDSLYPLPLKNILLHSTLFKEYPKINKNKLKLSYVDDIRCKTKNKLPVLYPTAYYFLLYVLSKILSTEENKNIDEFWITFYTKRPTGHITRIGGERYKVTKKAKAKKVAYSSNEISNTYSSLLYQVKNLFSTHPIKEVQLEDIFIVINK